MEKTWKDAIIRVLEENGKPLHYTEITDQILSLGYFTTDGATPAATVNAQLAASIKHDTNSPFLRVDKGVFTLKKTTIAPCVSPQQGTTTDSQTDAELLTEKNSELADSIIQSFGMYWQRDRIVWRPEPKIFGKQQASAKAVDFAKQKGIYILYDYHTVLYVGRCIDRPLGKRLYEHTLDRLSGRWNRFSWFGLLDVTETGALTKSMSYASFDGLIATLEALLIEALEPPQNRKRGDNFSAIEYIQGEDPELKEMELQTTLASIASKIRTV